MEYLIDILIWCLIVFSISNTLAVSVLFQPVRDLLHPVGIRQYAKNEWKVWDSKKEDWVLTDKRPIPILGKLITCPMCLGFWFGLVMSVVWFSPSHNIITDGFFGSISSWLLYLSIQEKQFGQHQG
tara:strand:+ start:916 stop:1293 length:378 start_codon:yes stop_codon:yes gene_type:complete